MNVLLSFAAVMGLALLAFFGAQVAGLRLALGGILPYAAVALFLGGMVYRVVRWARTPVPFRIPTSCGQQRSLSWIPSSRLDNPHTMWGVIGRMALEVLLFRSLFRNVRPELRDGPRLVYGPTKWLWAAALAFHWSFLFVLVRHLRFFMEPVPCFVSATEAVDGFFQVGVPVVLVTGFLLLVAVTYLFLRRVVTPSVRYISFASDYFPLFLLMAIAGSGLLLRYIFKTDIGAVKELAMGLVTFHPAAPETVSPLFYSHLFLVTVLFAYFPFSKLVHAAGVFLSPARNMANNNRAKRHINPWDHPVHVHTYEEYEDEFREKMVAAGLPVDKE